MRRLKNAVLGILLMLFVNTYAQKTGNFDTNYVMNSLPFNGTARTLSLHVPTNYDPNLSYALVVGLHGFNQSSGTLRDKLSFLSNTMDLIVICPSGNGNQHDDEFNGDEINIVDEALNFAVNNYNIDGTSVYLTGFSWGGRESVYYGLDHYQDFKGIIPFAPAWQSISDANNGFAYPWSQPFNYVNGKNIPTCICVGDADATFYNAIQQGYSNMVAAGANVSINVIPGVGHTLNFTTFEQEYMECFEAVNTVVGMASLPENTVGISMYPNPTSGHFTIKMREETHKGAPAKLRIFNAVGETIMVKDFQYEIVIDPGFRPGIYIIEISNEEGQVLYREKLINN